MLGRKQGYIPPKELNYSKSRLLEVEASAKNLNKILDNQSSNWKENLTQSQANIKLLGNQIKELKSEFHKSVIYFLATVEAFKSYANSESYNRFLKRLDTWKPEEIMTQAEFKKQALEIIKEEIK